MNLEGLMVKIIPGKRSIPRMTGKSGRVVEDDPSKTWILVDVNHKQHAIPRDCVRVLYSEPL